MVSEAAGGDEAVRVGWMEQDLQEHLELGGPGLSLTNVMTRLMRGGGTNVIQSPLVEFKFGRTSMSTDITTVSGEWCTLVFPMSA